MKRSCHFWCWSTPSWMSFWDAHGSRNTLPKWIGEAMRFFSGGITVNNTVCSEYLLLPTHSSKIIPPAWRVPNQTHLSTYPTSTGRSRTYSVRKPLRTYHHIGLGTVPSTSCLKLNSRKVEYIRCPAQSKLP